MKLLWILKTLECCKKLCLKTENIVPLVLICIANHPASCIAGSDVRMLLLLVLPHRAHIILHHVQQDLPQLVFDETYERNKIKMVLQDSFPVSMFDVNKNHAFFLLSMCLKFSYVYD